ncbi:hypothetical protein H5410_013331 [Solanum commersonii]|uniref:Uncharacterized protein n=1 Tax=Solanum commersonii TaxID=4109 RepID=A0A9J6AUT9_SOLCO|nr:hypothetical protein H5410_013331 [Solanum commersonii]
MEKDNNDLRAAMLKKRYANLILKSQQEVLGEVSDEEKMKKKAKLCENQLKKTNPARSWKEIEKRLGSPLKASKGRFILTMLFKPKEIFWPSSVLPVVGTYDGHIIDVKDMEKDNKNLSGCHVEETLC